MVGVVIFTHGTLGESLIRSAELIVGKPKNCVSVGLEHGDSLTEFEKRCAESIEAVDEGEGVIAFVDFYGGTPANTVIKYRNKRKMPCVTGVNMPMLLEVLTARTQCRSLNELEVICVKTGKENIFEIGAKLKKHNKDSDNTDF